MPSLEDFNNMPIDQVIARAVHTEQSDALLNNLLNDPATREQTLRLIKAKNPRLSIPEIDARDGVMGAVSASDKRIEALEHQIQNQQIHDRIRTNRAAIKAEYNFTDADIEGVEALMVDPEAPIPNYKAAAKVYQASRQVAVPTAGALTSPTFDMPAMDIWKRGIGNAQQLDKIGTNEAFKALEEFRSGKLQ